MAHSLSHSVCASISIDVPLFLIDVHPVSLGRRPGRLPLTGSLLLLWRVPSPATRRIHSHLLPSPFANLRLTRSSVLSWVLLGLTSTYAVLGDARPGGCLTRLRGEVTVCRGRRLQPMSASDHWIEDAGKERYGEAYSEVVSGTVSVIRGVGLERGRLWK